MNLQMNLQTYPRVYTLRWLISLFQGLRTCKPTDLKLWLTAVLLSVLVQSSSAQVVVNSPQAVDLVKYQRIPVSYFNGLPTIGIPLYTAEVKDLSLPLSLSYHASGIRVNQYPTLVGLGWTLHAGGAITRVVNGVEDEKQLKDLYNGVGYEKDTPDPGYYSSSKYLAGHDWASKNALVEDIRWSAGHWQLHRDGEPDEFVINAYGISGSFYLYRDASDRIQVRVKPGSGEAFAVSPPVIRPFIDKNFYSDDTPKPLKAWRLEKLFYEFTVVKQDGTRLVFGGDEDCIEFASEKRYMARSGSPAYCKTLATSWMLREVVSPKGNKIAFSYCRNGNPVAMSDVITDLITTSYNQDKDRGKQFRVLHPLYPKQIVVDSVLTIDFSLSRSKGMGTVRPADVTFLNDKGFKELQTEYLYYEPPKGEDFPELGPKTAYAPHNFFMKLDSIRIFQSNRLLCKYTLTFAELAAERLKLASVQRGGATGSHTETHRFAYDAGKLPHYNSTETDNWGYYNGKDIRIRNITDPGLYEFRSPNTERCRSEILTAITYPTGGTAAFTYEGHDYARIATQIPDFALRQESGKAGGVRIRRIAYRDEGTERVHSFEYLNEDGASSGILSGIPRYSSEGKQHVSLHYAFWDKLLHFKEDIDFTQTFRIYSEHCVNTLGDTNGNHVTYSRVTEKIGRTNPLVKIYRYTNHDTHPDRADYATFTDFDDLGLDNKFTSHALLRGLLVEETWLNDSARVKQALYAYNDTSSYRQDYMRAVEKYILPGGGAGIYAPFRRYTPYRIWTFYPTLKERREVTYDPTGRTVLADRTERFTYNTGYRIVAHRTWESDGDLLETNYTYPSDYSKGIYPEMVKRGMTGMPVETKNHRNERLTGGTLTTYREMDSLIVADKSLKLDLPEPVSYITSYDGSTYDSRYRLLQETLGIDRQGNPRTLRTEDGQTVSYSWGYRGMYPTAKVEGARNTYREAITAKDVWRTGEIRISNNMGSFNSRTYRFTTLKPRGTVTINLYGKGGYNWYLSGHMDSEYFNLVNCQTTTDKMPWSSFVKQYKSSVEYRNVPAGEHDIFINQMFCDVTDRDPGGRCTYSYQTIQTDTLASGTNEWLHEDFEDTSGDAIHPFGFHSERSYCGAYTVALKGASDRRYVIDYRVYRNGAWQYVRKPMTGRTHVIDEGTAPIDEVRAYPEDARMTSYTYYPFAGMRSATDSRGTTEVYEYDDLQRLTVIRDNEGNVKQTFTYHYQNQ